MSDEESANRPAATQADLLSPAVRAAIAAVTPARLFLTGPRFAYPTSAWLSLRADHAAARDAVASTLDRDDPAIARLISRHDPLLIATEASSPDEHLRRPDLGRRLTAASAEALRTDFSPAPPPTLCIGIGDGLSALAATTQGPALLDAVIDGAATRGWSVGRPLLVRHCRVGLLNEIGDATQCDVVVLLVGERPGLAVSDGLSAYLAYRPRPGDTDAQRNLVSGIHHRGTPPTVAAVRVLDLVAQLLDARRSGVTVKERYLPAPGTIGPSAIGPSAIGPSAI